MNPIAIRLLNQQLVAPEFDDPVEVVGHLGAVQAQEYRMMRWAVSMRIKKPSAKAFKDAFDNGNIIRLHLMRGTWQLVTAEDYWMMIDLCAAKAIAVTKGWEAPQAAFPSWCFPAQTKRRTEGIRVPVPLGLGRQLHSQSVAPFVPRKCLPDRAFPGAVLPPRGRWMCCAGFPCAFGLPSTSAAQGNQPMISELWAVLWSQVWSPMPGTRERRGWLPAGACKPVLGRAE